MAPTPPSPDRLAWLADRMEIDDLLVRYGTALDTHDYDLFDEVFTPDADLDYEVVGGFRGSPAEFKEWIAAAAGYFSTWLHHVTNSTVTIEGDTAQAVTYLINPVVMAHDDRSLMEGGRYHDTLVRTPDGWRISARREEPLWHNWPAELRPQPTSDDA